MSEPIRLRIPRDANGDRIADCWQDKQNAEWNDQFKPTTPRPITPASRALVQPDLDNEEADSDGSGPYPAMASIGDGLMIREEYRGYIFDGGPGTTPGGHKRLSVARKELLVECSEMDGISSVGTTLPPDPSNNFVDHGNQANAFAQGYSLSATMDAVSEFFGKEVPPGFPGYFPGAILDTYWVRDQLDDIRSVVIYNSGIRHLAYKYSGPYIIHVAQSQAIGSLSITSDEILRIENHDRHSELYGGGEGVAILANNDNRNKLCGQFIKLAVEGRKGKIFNDNSANAVIGQAAREQDESHEPARPTYQGAAIFVNSYSEDSVWATQGSFSEQLAWAVAHELGHLFIHGRGIAPFDGGEHILNGTNNLMNTPIDISNCNFHEYEIKYTNLPQRASIILSP